ncbi:MAG: hypothetical protein LC800_14730 [Acidobacteria bacterium]|nr:hypothetical protein [Acidobacteriota bacterium]
MKKLLCLSVLLASATVAATARTSPSRSEKSSTPTAPSGGRARVTDLTLGGARC